MMGAVKNAYHDEICGTTPADEMRAALEECEAYFEERADAEHYTDGMVGNEEMQMLVMVQAALGRKI